MVVNNVAESLSISPTPVKEAMNRLVAEGLLVMLPRRGFMVKQLNIEEVRDVMNCRMMMETFAADSAAKNFHKHPDIQRRMLEVLGKLETVQSEDYVKAAQLEQIFHSSIVELAENEKLNELYHMLFGVSISFHVYASSKHPMERLDDAQTEHRLMYLCLEEGNVQRLEELLRTHLVRTMKIYETFLPHIYQS